MASVRKRIEPFITIARAHGARVFVDDARRHLRLIVETSCGDRCILTMARTPSDWRGDLNGLARLRRALRNA